MRPAAIFALGLQWLALGVAALRLQRASRDDPPEDIDEVNAEAVDYHSDAVDARTEYGETKFESVMRTGKEEN